MEKTQTKIVLRNRKPKKRQKQTKKVVKIIRSRNKMNKSTSQAGNLRAIKLVKQMAGFLKNRKVQPQTTYQQSVLFPELMLKAQIPRQFGLVTLPLSRHITVPITANVLGNFFLAFQPYFLSDNTNASYSLAINNVATYDGSSTIGTGAVIVATPFSLPQGNVQAYSLVSASLIIQPQTNWSTITGKLGMASIPFPPNAGTAGASVPNYTLAVQTFANIENQAHYSEADLQNSESGRMLYTVNDIHDFEKFSINNDSASNENETTFLVYCTGAPNAAKFNLEIFLNFEVTVVPGSALAGLGKPCTSIEDPSIIHTQVANSKIVTQAIKGYSSSSMQTATIPNNIHNVSKEHNKNIFNKMNGTDRAQFVEKFKHSLGGSANEDINQHHKELESMFSTDDDIWKF